MKPVKEERREDYFSALPPRQVRLLFSISGKKVRPCTVHCCMLARLSCMVGSEGAANTTFSLVLVLGGYLPNSTLRLLNFNTCLPARILGLAAAAGSQLFDRVARPHILASWLPGQSFPCCLRRPAAASTSCDWAAGRAALAQVRAADGAALLGRGHGSPYLQPQYARAIAARVKPIEGALARAGFLRSAEMTGLHSRSAARRAMCWWSAFWLFRTLRASRRCCCCAMASRLACLVLPFCLRPCSTTDLAASVGVTALRVCLL